MHYYKYPSLHYALHDKEVVDIKIECFSEWSEIYRQIQRIITLTLLGANIHPVIVYYKDKQMLDAIKAYLSAYHRNIPIYEFNSNISVRDRETTANLIRNISKGLLLLPIDQYYFGIDLKFNKTAIVIVAGPVTFWSKLVQMVGRGSRDRTITQGFYFCATKLTPE
jgi:hypothetical protein